MSYSNTKKISMYDLRRFNKQFRLAWERGLKDAEKRAASLEKQGWLIDVSKGAITREQMKRYAHKLEREFEVDFVPATKIDDVEIGFLAYKPKPKEERKEKPKKEEQTSLSGATPKERFVNIFGEVAEITNADKNENAIRIITPTLVIYMFLTHKAIADPNVIVSDNQTIEAYLRDKAKTAISIISSHDSITYSVSLNNVDELIKKLDDAEKSGKKYLTLYEDPYNRSEPVPSIPIQDAKKLLKVVRGEDNVVVFLSRNFTQGYSRSAVIMLPSSRDAILIETDRMSPNDKGVISIMEVQSGG